MKVGFIIANYELSLFGSMKLHRYRIPLSQEGL